MLRLFLNNPGVGSLYKAVARGGGTLAIYDDLMVERLQDAPKKGGEDFEFLSHAAQGKTPASSFLQGPSARPLVRPSFSGVLICVKQTLAHLLCSDFPKIVDFRNRLLLARVVGRRGRPGTDSGAGLSALKSWAARIARLVTGQNGEPRRLTLSHGAFTLLGDFVRKLDRMPEGQMRSPEWAPILAAKISLLLHLFSAHPGKEITEATMQTGIALAECLLRESALTARDCMTDQEGIELEEQLDRMQEKIQQLQPVRFRKLRRTYPRQDAAPLRIILDELFRRGRARFRQPGLIAIALAGGGPPVFG